MSGRDLLETSFHALLLLLVWGPMVAVMRDSRWLRWLFGLIILGGLVYHVVVVAGCHQNPYLCA